MTSTTTIQGIYLLLLSSFLYTLISLIRKFLHRSHLRAQHACLPPPAYPHTDPFGTDDLRASTTAYKSRTLLARTAQKYRQHGLTFSSRFLTQTIINTIEPANIRAVLATDFDKFGVGWRRKNAFRPLLGESLFQSDGRKWRQSRDVLAPAFAHVRVGQALEAMKGVVEAQLRMIAEAAGRERDREVEVDLAPHFFRLSTDMATIFIRGQTGRQSQEDEDKKVVFVDAMKKAGGGCEKRWQLGIFSYVVPQRAFDREVVKVHTFMQNQVDEVLAASAEDGEKGRRYDFLASLAEKTKDRRVLRDEACMLYTAAADTVGCLLVNLFFMIGTNTAIWDKLRQEAKAFEGRDASVQELKRLKYHDYCVREALRLLPVLPSDSREALVDTVLPVGGGPDGRSPVLVPAGTVVSFSIRELHRRKDLWGEDAEDFRPERWEDLKAGWHYMPFLQGPRLCLGHDLATNQVIYVLFRMVQRFRKVARTDSEPWVESVSIGTTSANGAKVVLISDESYVPNS